MESRNRNLDASGGRTVVYCHQCQNEWYQDEHGVRQCPYCQSDIVEVVTPGADDPRMPMEDDDDNGVRQFDRTPHPYHLHSRNHHLENADDNAFDSDPEEGDIEEHIQTGPGVYVRTRFYSSGPRRNGHGNNGRRAPADPNDPASVINRFQEMLMNDFSVGIPGRSGPDTLFPSDRDNPFGNPSGTFQRTTFVSNSSPGGSSMAFTLGGSPAPPPPQAPQFEQYASPTPSRRPPNRVILVSFSSETNGEPARLFGNFMGNARPPNRAGSSQSPTGEGAPHPANSGGLLAQSLADILSVLMPIAGGGISGDVVYSQEAMDRILTQLMEQNPLSNAPPPASDTALEKLTRKKLDAEMLGPDGKGECTICIDEMRLGEQATVLPCKHWFHEDCVVSWLKEHNTCPICRHSVETEKETSAAEAEPARASGAGPSVQASSSSNIRNQPATPNLSDCPTLGGGRPTRLGRTEEERRARLDSIRANAGLGPTPLSTFSPSNYNSRRRHSRSPDSSSRRSSTYGGLDRDRDRERDRERDERNRGERDIRQSRLNYFTGLGRGGPNGGNEGSGSSHGQSSRRYGSGNNGNGSGSENSDSQGSQGISGWIRSAFHQGRRS